LPQLLEARGGAGGSVVFSGGSVVNSGGSVVKCGGSVVTKNPQRLIFQGFRPFSKPPNYIMK